MITAHDNTERGLLLVDDLPLEGGAVGRAIRQAFRLEVARTSAEALVLIQRRGPFAAAIIDVHLEDDHDGFDVARDFADSHPDVSILLISGDPKPDYPSRALGLGATFADTIEFYPKTLFAFGASVLCREFVADRCLRAVTERFLLKQADLALVDAKIVALACADVRNVDIQSRLGMPVDTFKSRVRRLLERTHFESLGDLVMALRADAREAN